MAAGSTTFIQLAQVLASITQQKFDGLYAVAQDFSQGSVSAGQGLELQGLGEELGLVGQASSATMQALKGAIEPSTRAIAQ